ncbi:putative domain XH [Sesbania bispinosa]|nr:putative domain XH [Sesbania bispinosa]
MGIVERSIRGANIGVKRMGELDTRPFLKAMRAKKIYNEEDAALRALEMCSMWEKYLADPHWYPFKIITVDGKSKEIIDDGDAKLERLKKEMGVGAYKAVVEALTEMNEYNPSGRFVISELWNYRLGRSATLEEGVEFLLGQWKSKKQKIHQTGKQHNHYKLATITKCKNAGDSSGEDSDDFPLSLRAHLLLNGTAEMSANRTKVRNGGTELKL